MSKTPSQLEALRDLIREFVDEREWDQFHTPKNLSMALAVEAAELLEIFQWLKTGEPEELSNDAVMRVRHEVADILVYLIRLADKMDIDLEQAARKKIELNILKYPTDKVRGDSRKYNEY